MLPKKRSTPTTQSKSKRLRASELMEETAEAVIKMPPQNLNDGRHASSIRNDISGSHASCPASTRAGHQSTNSGPAGKELLEATVQDEVPVFTEGRAVQATLTQGG